MGIEVGKWRKEGKEGRLRIFMWISIVSLIISLVILKKLYRSIRLSWNILGKLRWFKLRINIRKLVSINLNLRN